MSTEQRLSERAREDVVEIEVELPDRPDAGAARVIDRNDRLEADLEVASDPDHARTDRAGDDEVVAEIVLNGRYEPRFDDRDQVIEEVRKSEVDYVRLEIGHAELERVAP